MNSVKNTSKFEKSLEELLKISKDILVANDKINLKFSSKKNPVLARLENYIKTTESNETDASDHIWSFQKIYEKNKRAILRGPAGDSWLTTTGKEVTVNFGEQFSLRNDIKIHLTIIYSNACKIRDQIEESLQGLPDINQAEELLYVPTFMLRLYEIFAEVCDFKEDKEKLEDFIDILSKEAKIKTTKAKAANNDPLSGFMDMVTPIMKQMGVQLPEGQKMPSAQELTNNLQTMMQRPEVSSKIGNVLKDLQGCNNLGEMFSKVMSRAGLNSAAVDSIKDNINYAETAETSTLPNDSNGDGNAGGYGSGDEFID